jgi:hypothetical protein
MIGVRVESSGATGHNYLCRWHFTLQSSNKTASIRISLIGHCTRIYNENISLCTFGGRLSSPSFKLLTHAFRVILVCFATKCVKKNAQGEYGLVEVLWTAIELVSGNPE